MELGTALRDLEAKLRMSEEHSEARTGGRYEWNFYYGRGAYRADRFTIISQDGNRLDLDNVLECTLPDAWGHALEESLPTIGGLDEWHVSNQPGWQGAVAEFISHMNVTVGA